MSEQLETRVLVVEDDPLVGRMIEELLEEVNCTLVGRAADGQQAVQMTQSTRPDVVLMDIKMPDVDGLEATRLIRKHCPTPVVMLTAYETPELVQEASAAGAGAYLIKPPSARELGRAITIAMARFDDMMVLQRRAAELEAVHQASLRLTASLKLEPVLNALLEQVLDLCNAYDAHIFLYDGEQLSFGASLWADGTQGEPFASPRPDGLTYAVAKSGERIAIPDMSIHPLFENRNWSGRIIGLPLSIGERVIGVMNVAYETPQAFSEDELRILELLAAQAAIAIQNANLYEQIEHHAAELEQRVAERTRELTEANRKLQDLDRLKSQFINDISHELRTPAANVRLYLQLLENGAPEKQDHYLKVLEDQTSQLIRVIEDILHFSQLELSKPAFEPADLNIVVGQVIDAYQERARAAGLEMIYKPGAALPPVRAAVEQLTQVVVNLINNAINYTSDGHIHVSTYWDAERDQVCLQVQDTGRGITPEDMAHVFKRFYRGQGVGSSNIPGAGLGMSVAHEIVKMHGGTIEVESQLGEGSTFRVWLPPETDEA